MRERTKREILELLDTVNEALCHLQAARTADSLLSDCRAAIAAIGRSLAEDGDAHALLSRKLQRFAAALAKAAQQGAALKQAEILALAEELHRLRRKVAGMRARLEIVFLPYKASMWDSLESIWRAAAADPDCDAYVVPIPYYDLHPDHTAAKFHYEGGLYPADVPITDYRAYDLATRRPDVIYIHNPYDGCNRVTSVDPAYYSERLKQYTDMLVYVPYFVVAGDKISEHFCQTPGVYHADRVIVQSEAIKKTYAKFIPAEKILALGSPKFDKVAWMMKHPPAMPKEWAEIARGRKLVLYNTHLSPLIVDDGSVCRKLRYVFSVFEGREDVCLLWRPHPLSEAAMQSMNPKPLAEYLQLVETFKQKKLGIFDDSPDVHRAIALSDAYYGDASSLVALYESTGKPVMLQNLEIDLSLEKESKQILFFTDAVFFENEIWFSPYFYNGIFKMNLKTKKVEFLKEFSQKETKKLLYRRMIKEKDKVFFIPSDAKKILEMNVNTLEEKTYDYAHLLRNKMQENQFIDGFVYEERLWLIPDGRRCILEINLNNGQIKIHKKWYEELKKQGYNFMKQVFVRAIHIKKDIWCLSWEQNLLMKFNLETKEIKAYRIGDRGRKYSDFCFNGKEFFLLPMDNRELIAWSPVDEEIIYSKEINYGRENPDNLFCKCAFLNGYVWLFPALAENIIRMSITTGNCEIVPYPKGFQYEVSGGGCTSKYTDVKQGKEKIIAFPQKGNMLLFIEMSKNEIYGESVSMQEGNRLEENKVFLHENYDEKRLLGEYVHKEIFLYSSLKHYLDYIKSKSDIDSMERKNKENGNNIHFTISQLI